jgi:hypothetical protein
MLTVVVEEEGFGTSFAFVITGAGSNAVDIPPVVFRLGMDGGVPINFGSGSLKDLCLKALGQA